MSHRSGRSDSHGHGRASSGLDDRDRLHCDHCGRTHHSKATCRDLHGRPREPISRSTQQGVDLRSTIGDRSNAYVATPTDVAPFTILLEPSAISGGELASRTSSASQIIDSDVSHHMTGTSFLSTYIVSSS